MTSVSKVVKVPSSPVTLYIGEARSPRTFVVRVLVSATIADVLVAAGEHSGE